MEGAFHPGELDLQRRAGTLQEAATVGRIIAPHIPAGAGPFLERQRFAVASTLAAGGQVWASLLTGPAGFARIVDPELLLLAARPQRGDPLVSNLAARTELGLLVLDPRTRQRMRFNGRALLSDEGVFLQVEQVYGNCPKYIQRRALSPGDVDVAPGAPRVSGRLSRRQQERLRRADTFFIASFHPAGGADASHRGGRPDFVRVLGAQELAFSDYPGNGMFNTLGNLVAYPPAGLLFVDFESGDVLQISGRARVEAGFSVHFDVESVRDTPAASPLRWSLVEASPSLPPLSRSASGGI